MTSVFSPSFLRNSQSTGTISNLGEEEINSPGAAYVYMFVDIVLMCTYHMQVFLITADEMLIIMQAVQPLDALSEEALALVSISAASL